MNLTVGTLIAAGIAPTQARIFAEPLAAACQRFAIVTPARLGAFIAQCRVESADFTRLEENLRYTKPERLRAVFPSRVRDFNDAADLIRRGPQAIANRVYAGKIGNGDEASGDGFRFIGRGIKMLTGRANYADAAEALGFDYLAEPWLVATPLHACLTASWFWHTVKGNLLADSWQIAAITRAVNGPGMLQADLREQYAEEASRAFA